LKAKDVVVVGVSFDSVEDNRHFAEKFNFPFQLLSDTSRDIGMKYGAADNPSASHAKRVAFLVDPSGKIERVWSKVDVNSFADEVLGAVSSARS
jgi:peroxiredoxin Q/BCP